MTKAAVSKWELGQSLPDVALLPRIAAFFSLTLDELFDWRPRMGEAEAAALYASVYAEAAEDLPAAHARLMEVARNRWSDWGLLVTLATLLTSWAAGWAAPDAGEPGETEAPERLLAEAHELLDRVLDGASDPALLFAATQVKASALFQQGELEGVVALLDPLVRREDAGAATMLLASALRGTGRDEEAWELLQARCLQDATDLESLMLQQVGMGDDATFAAACAEAVLGVHESLGLGAVNPHYPMTVALEAASALRRAGDADGAVAWLGRAVDAAATDEVPAPAAEMPLFAHVSERLDPTQVSPEWAEHKEAQAARMLALVREGLVGAVTGDEWAPVADDPRYREVVRRAEVLAS